MAYFFDSELPLNKPVFFALTCVYGISKTHSSILCKKLGFSINFKVKNLSKKQLGKLKKVIKIWGLVVGRDLKKFERLKNEKWISIKSYRGLRKNRGLPIRGQRTHTNARTARKRY